MSEVSGVLWSPHQQMEQCVQHEQEEGRGGSGGAEWVHVCCGWSWCSCCQQPSTKQVSIDQSLISIDLSQKRTDVLTNQIITVSFNDRFSCMERYDPCNDTWTMVANLSIGRITIQEYYLTISSQVEMLLECVFLERSCLQLEVMMGQHTWGNIHLYI